MKRKIAIIIFFISIVMIVTGTVISLKDTGKHSKVNSIVSNSKDVYSYKNDSNDWSIESINDKISSINKNIISKMNIKNPNDYFFIKTINGKEYYVLKTIETTSSMKHQQTYTKLAKIENRKNLTNCLCYAYAYSQKMIYGYVSSDYAEVLKCDYPGTFGLELYSGSDNLHVAFNEILNNRPSVIHGTGCGGAGQHYFIITGILKSAFEEYVENGKTNEEFNKLSKKNVKNYLLAYDPWGENIENMYYNLNENVSYYDYECVWNVDDTIRYKTRN